MIFRAIKFVAEAHEGHYRKGTNIPYVSHLMNVMKILCENDCDTEVIVAGILHDVIEDTHVTIDIVERKFGKRVANIISDPYEPEKIQKGSKWESSWKERKQHTVEHLKKSANLDKLIVSCADKLDNARAIQQDYSKLGENFWLRFNAGKEEQRWYYQSLGNAFMDRGKEFGNPLLTLATELDKTVKEIFKQ